MAVNSDKPDRWKRDIAASVDLYNDWFLQFAPETYRQERVKATEHVEAMLERTRHLTNLTIAELRNHPSILFALRMATAPPIARDRLVGLARVQKSLVNAMELHQRLPKRMPDRELDRQLTSIASMITRLADRDILAWLAEGREPTEQEVYRAATIIADRLCGANADPIVRNAQEQRQLDRIKAWLEARGYRHESGVRLADMRPGSFAFRLIVIGVREDETAVNIPVDAVVMPLKAKRGQLPLMIEAKSAGDFTNTNKRRKEEATKMVRLRKRYGSRVRYILFLCGYFDAGYLGYEASGKSTGSGNIGSTILQNSDCDMGDGIEDKRLDLLARLDQSKSQAERNRLGQFATPTALAEEIMSQALDLLADEAPIRFLEPGFGTGPFYSALLRQVKASRIKVAAGYELDKTYGEPARCLWDGTKLQLELADFTETPPPVEENKYNLIISNPPYVRHHHLDQAQKQRLQVAVERYTGVAMNGLAGLYTYFLVLSRAWMSEGSVGAWLVPSEFMDVNYGRQVKRFLLENVTLHRIHRFEPADVQFGDALVSSAVVLFTNELPAANHRPIFSFGGTLSKPKASETLARDELRHVKKWTSLPNGRARKMRKPQSTLAELFKIKRGIATGNNSFFVLSAPRVKELGLPKKFLTPILPSPRNLKDDEIRADERGEPLIDARRYLLVCDLPENVVEAEYPALWNYLESGKSQGIHERYLCRHREPWYSQESRPPAPFLCTYMGRHTAAGRHPFRFLFNHSNATAANVYLLLYPKPALADVLASDDECRRAVWQALSSITPDMLLGEGRVYGGGLHKMEPSELASVPAEIVLRALPAVKLPKRQAELFR